jgi:hypothetical protein
VRLQLIRLPEKSGSFFLFWITFQLRFMDVHQGVLSCIFYSAFLDDVSHGVNPMP